MANKLVCGATALLTHARKPLRSKLMFAASAGIMAVAMPGGGVYGTRASAQVAIPDFCEVTDGPNAILVNNNSVDPGETITCPIPFPLPQGNVGPIDLQVEDLTVVLGGDNPATTSPVKLAGEGVQTLDIKSNGSVVNVSNPTASDLIYMTNNYGSLSLVNSGTIQSGNETQTGRAVKMHITNGADAYVGTGALYLYSSTSIIGEVYTRNDGQGSTTLFLGGVTTTDSNAVTVEAAGGVEITSNGTIMAGDDGFNINVANLAGRQDGVETKLNIGGTVTGSQDGADILSDHDVVVDFSGAGSLTGTTGRGLEVEAANAVTSITVSGGDTGQVGTISGETEGINLVSAQGDITIRNLTSVTGSTRDGIKVRSTGGEIRIENIGDVFGGSGFFGSAINAVSSVTAYQGGGISGGGDISIQNLSVIDIEDPDNSNGPKLRSRSGIIASSGTANINIGAEDPENGTGIGPIQTQSYGIIATTFGGDVNIYASDYIETVRTGISVINGRSTGEIKIVAHDIKSERANGISVVSQSDGTTEIVIKGRVIPGVDGSGMDFPALRVETFSGATVIVDETGEIESGGIAFNDSPSAPKTATDDTFTLLGSVAGDVIMNAGEDTFNLGSFDFETVDGGDGTDTLNIVGSTELEINDAVLEDAMDFEHLGFDADSAVITGDLSGWERVNFNAGTTRLAEGVSLTADRADILPGATFNARDGSVMFGALFNDGTLEIGSSPGTFTLNGDFTQGSTGELPIEFDGDVFDRFIINGEANLDGTLNVIVLNNSSPSLDTVFEFLTATNVNGTFSNVIDNLPDLNIDFTVDADSGQLSFVLDTNAGTGNTGNTGTGTGGTGTGTGTGGTGGTGDTTTGSGQGNTQADSSTTSGTTSSQGTQSLVSAKQIAPSSLLQALHTNDLFASTLIERHGATLEANQWAFWAGGFGATSRVGFTGDTAGWQSDTSGYGIGVERLSTEFGAPVLFGLSAGYSESDTDSFDSLGRLEGYHVGLFARTDVDAWSLAGALSYAMQDMDYTRYLRGTNMVSMASGDTDSAGWTLKTEAFYDINTDSAYAFGPVLTFDALTAEYEAFVETGAGILNLTYTGEEATQTVFGLGGQGRFDGDLGGWAVDTGIRVVWETLGGDRDVEATAYFEGIDGLVASRSSRLDADRLALGFDTRLYLSDGVFAHIRYDGAASDKLIDHAGWAGITIAF